jgi:uncharacterized membrane protein
MDQSQIIGIGIAIIFIGIIVIFSSMFFAPSTKSETKFSVFGIFGFIPFGFSNDKKLFIFSIILTVVIILVSLFLFYRRIK